MCLTVIRAAAIVEGGFGNAPAIRVVDQAWLGVDRVAAERAGG
jgi:hypothetical protein